MKKFMAILFSLLLVLSFALLVSCKKKEQAPAPATTEQAPAAQQSPAAEQSPAKAMAPEKKAATEKAPEKAKAPAKKSTGGY